MRCGEDFALMDPAPEASWRLLARQKVMQEEPIHMRRR